MNAAEKETKDRCRECRAPGDKKKVVGYEDGRKEEVGPEVVVNRIHTVLSGRVLPASRFPEKMAAAFRGSLFSVFGEFSRMKPDLRGKGEPPWQIKSVTRPLNM